MSYFTLRNSPLSADTRTPPTFKWSWNTASLAYVYVYMILFCIYRTSFPPLLALQSELHFSTFLPIILFSSCVSRYCLYIVSVCILCSKVIISIIFFYIPFPGEVFIWKVSISLHIWSFSDRFSRTQLCKCACIQKKYRNYPYFYILLLRYKCTYVSWTKAHK